jgi:hypothetical protein
MFARLRSGRFQTRLRHRLWCALMIHIPLGIVISSCLWLFHVFGRWVLNICLAIDPGLIILGCSQRIRKAGRHDEAGQEQRRILALVSSCVRLSSTPLFLHYDLLLPITTHTTIVRHSLKMVACISKGKRIWPYDEYQLVATAHTFPNRNFPSRHLWSLYAIQA